LAFVAAGCGGAIPSSNGGPATLKMTSGKAGSFLVDSRGHTLYLFEKDEGGESYCNGACAAVWPPLETSSTPSAAGGIDSGAVGTIKRDDGDMQVTYHGHPLYYYAADASKPGKTSGEGVEQFGAEWYVVGASGKPVEPKEASSSGSPSNSGSNSGSNNGGGAWG
jgi:predicted lipoprotein with Yx(FWY)xxD motif